MTSNGEAEQPGSDHDLSRLLPDDVLADVLGRLAPRWLAASRCVCKAWHAVIDTRRLLRADLLPLSLDGIIIHFDSHVYSEFFSRPSPPTSPSISTKFEHLLTTDAWSEAIDHCNGLLLLRNENSDEYVANPATGWAAPLPPCPSPYRCTLKYLAFDPTVSPHYEVLLVPRFFQEELENSGWPPSFDINIFSSLSQRWEERSFIREGEPVGRIIRYSFDQHYAVYLRGSLYIHCETGSVMRISSSESKFSVIEPPDGIREERCEKLYLGRSEKGVYLASLCDCRFRVWILDESRGHMKWVLRHDNNLGHVLLHRHNNLHAHGPWILQDINYRSGVLDRLLDDNEESLSTKNFKWNSAPPDEKFEWNSDGDDVVDDKDAIKMRCPGYINILGFHPSKEIVFLSEWLHIGLAYYLNTSRVQVVGNLYPTNYDSFVTLPYERQIMVSFPYTPCLIEMCPRHN